MSALNERFRPTYIFMNITAPTIMLGLLSFVLSAFGIVFIFKKVYFLSLILISAGLIMVLMTIKYHLGIKGERVRNTVFTGRRDLKMKSQELL